MGIRYWIDFFEVDVERVLFGFFSGVGLLMPLLLALVGCW